jgi:hypothetical protein
MERVVVKKRVALGFLGFLFMAFVFRVAFVFFPAHVMFQPCLPAENIRAELSSTQLKIPVKFRPSFSPDSAVVQKMGASKYLENYNWMYCQSPDEPPPKLEAIFFHSNKNFPLSKISPAFGKLDRQLSITFSAVSNYQNKGSAPSILDGVKDPSQTFLISEQKSLHNFEFQSIRPVFFSKPVYGKCSTNSVDLCEATSKFTLPNGANLEVQFEFDLSETSVATLYELMPELEKLTTAILGMN